MLMLIGDCHGKYKQYLEIIKDVEFSLQLGDFGFSYSSLHEVDSNRHCFFSGNHDNYDFAPSCPHNLGDFGKYELGGVKFFFMRGGFSIDKKYRTIGINWWADEELSRVKMEEAIESYKRTKPEIMIAHECPREIANLIGSPDILRSFGFDPKTFTTRTSETLQTMFEIHQPRQFFFGHFHKSWTSEVNGTIFRCLNELETYILDDGL